MRNESKISFWDRFTIKALMTQTEEITMLKKAVRELQKLLNREMINKMKADKKMEEIMKYLLKEFTLKL